MKPTKKNSEDIRAKVRAQQEARMRNSQRNSLFLRLGILVVALAVAGVIVLAVVANNNAQNNSGLHPGKGPAPAGATEGGGIKLVAADKTDQSQLKEVDADAIELPSEDELKQAKGQPIHPTGAEGADGKPAHVLIYTDPACPHCGQFEKQYSGLLEEKLQAGEITVEYRTVTFMDNYSATRYSSRAANMMACVAEKDPAKFMKTYAAMFGAQKELSDEELVDLAQGVGVDVKECITEGTYRPFAKYTTKMAIRDKVPGTPMAWVDGQQWDPEKIDFKDFLTKILQQKK